MGFFYTIYNMNKLINESSPYLLQHANNPVHWQPWGEAALNMAIAQHKPILVSIGYAACHWCHVMEKESFENEEIALIMNEHFINIKIDREERPDIDHIYMPALQAITGSGGWPLNIFLLPNKQPFYGGTYFPPAPAYNRPSWKQVLLSIAKAFKEDYLKLSSQAENLTAHLISANLKLQNVESAETHQLSLQVMELIANNILQKADTIDGGFGNAPKFPQTFSILYLLRHYHFTKNKEALSQALLSINKMIQGGIYDQLAGGFCRYSTDKKWQIPHFEKMLYDNALLLQVIAEAYEITKDVVYKRVIEQTVNFLETELQLDEKVFYAAIDADSEGVEGKFYTWSKSEIEEVLMDDAAQYCTIFNISESGNWEHTNILWLPIALEEVANTLQLTQEALLNFIQVCNKKLLASRNKRQRPITDDKVLLGWNALLITALAKCYVATGNKKYLEKAETVFSFIEENMQGSAVNSYMHSYKNGVAKIDAFLDDYAYYIQACIQLQQVTGNNNYLEKANNIANYIIHSFSDEENCFFYFTHQLQQDVIFRKVDSYDGATPSANAVMALNFHYLGVLYNNQLLLDRCKNMLHKMIGSCSKYPTSFGMWSILLQLKFYPFAEIAIIGKENSLFLRQLTAHYIPNKIVQASGAPNKSYPLLNGKTVDNEKGETKVFVCNNYQCFAPVNSIEHTISLLIENEKVF